MRRGVLFFLASALAALALAPVAVAAYPGGNGNVLFDTDATAGLALPQPDIYSVTGGVARNLTASDPLWGDWDPAGSSDGKRIVFSSNRDGNSEIYSMSADGSDTRRLTADSAADLYPAISPDGSHVAFIKGGVDLYTMRSDGSELRRLTFAAPGGRIESPIFDTTGASIIFATTVFVQLPGFHTYRKELDAIGSDGSGLRRLADFDLFYGGQLTISPDGETLAFAGQREGDGSTEIYSMGLAGSGLTRLTTNSAEDRNPAFSPDGREILFQTDRAGSEDIYVMQGDGTGQRPLYASSGADENPEWAPSTLTCNHKRVTVLGTAGDDKLGGTPDGDVIIGGSGADRITGGAGDDTICSGKGGDTIAAGRGRDRLWGVGGADKLVGRRGADFLNGGPGHDFCNGAEGIDRGKLCERRRSIP